MNFKIGDRIFVRGYIDEIRKDTVIVRNDGGYFGTIPSEVITGELPSAQPEIKERTEEFAQNVPKEDLISRKAAIEAMSESLKRVFPEHRQIAKKCLKALPSAQPEQDVLAWLLAYHTKSFELHGRYFPHEVISWLVNDFSKEFIAERREDERPES